MMKVCLCVCASLALAKLMVLATGQPAAGGATAWLI